LAQQLIVDIVAELTGVLDFQEPIVEFGSLQVEPGQPSDLRPLFAGRRFIGTDVRSGAGVDRIEDLRSLTFSDEEVGTALCLDTLEHCEDPFAACRELHRVLRPGGVCIVSSVMMFPIHSYPHDYWRFTPEGFRLLLRPFDDVWVAGIGHHELPTQVIAVAAKGGTLGLLGERLRTVIDTQAKWERAEGRVSFGAVQLPVRQVLAVIVRQLPRAVAQRMRARIGGQG
jgi:SAM-dependent methyltransferase